MTATVGTIVRTTIRDAHRPISNRETFTAGSGTLSGSWASDKNIDCTGKLSKDHKTELRNAYANHGSRLYVVWSYYTPIAWGTEGHLLYVPAAKYSVTTSKHQGIVRRVNHSDS